MTLRRSETLFRLVIGLALALGFVGFATHSQVAQHTPSLVATAHASVGS
ncbi:MAG: hypothetical protein JWN48_166 [Myxococcaceae bacterium]|nr:hypothetical protein [Myxococcaceae bacterium]